LFFTSNKQKLEKFSTNGNGDLHKSTSAASRDGGLHRLLPPTQRKGWGHLMEVGRRRWSPPSATSISTNTQYSKSESLAMVLYQTGVGIRKMFERKK
jgi:hypothetical protein